MGLIDEEEDEDTALKSFKLSPNFEQVEQLEKEKVQLESKIIDLESELRDQKRTYDLKLK